MTDPIRLFVGTDPFQHIAEKALEASVREHTPGPVDITWMRQGDPGWSWGGWAAGWATPFTCFRWVIPEVCGHQGRAIYMDADQLALTDLRELWEMEILEGWACAAPQRPDVILWECDKVDRWELETIKRYGIVEHRRRLSRAMRLGDEWDDRDRYRPGVTKVLHYTRMATQPWKPYPQCFPYDQPHPDPKAVELFWEYAKKGGVDTRGQR